MRECKECGCNLPDDHDGDLCECCMDERGDTISDSMKAYETFLRSKSTNIETAGFMVDPDDLNPELYDFQKAIVRWALAKGKAAIFADCGLGKTAMQLEWSYQIHQHTGGKILILAPLAVTTQTAQEGIKFGIPCTVVESASDVVDGINITNYEKLDRFDLSVFEGVVLDESSILKSFTGKVRNQIIDSFSKTRFRLACTATPAPNDYMELGNHSEFLGVMTRSEMLSMFFVHDGGQTSKWRLKGHAEDIFWEWMCSWAVYVNSPADIGFYDMDGYDLPDLNMNEVIVDGDTYDTSVMTLTQRRKARKDTLLERCTAAAELVNNSDEQWLVWCDLNDESKTLASLINGGVEVKGSDSGKHKTESMLGFSSGEIKCLITKPSIAGFGMNWQNCHNMIFVGLSDSYEQFYQAVRRCWRFGQLENVNVHIVISAKEGAVKENIERKRIDFENMKKAMSEYTKEITKKELRKTYRMSAPYEPTIQMILPGWEELSA